MNIALRLQELIDQKKISRSRLARSINVHTSSVTNWLNGGNVSLENLKSLCDFFDCSMEYLTGEDKEEEKLAPNDRDGLDDMEQELISLFREIPEDRLDTPHA